MIAGHYATALIAHQKFPKGTLLFFLVASQFQDVLWFIFHYLGLETTSPPDVLDATISNMAVDMTYSHDVLPQVIWAGAIFLIGRYLFKSTTIGLVGLILFIGHFIMDFFSGHPHNIYGTDTHNFGLGLYATNAYLAILIETVLIVAVMTYYFRKEATAGIMRTRTNVVVIIGVFVYGIIFMLSVATVSFRELLGIPEFDFGFNTTVPTIIFTYVALAAALYWAVPKTSNA